MLCYTLRYYTLRYSRFAIHAPLFTLRYSRFAIHASLLRQVGVELGIKVLEGFRCMDAPIDPQEQFPPEKLLSPALRGLLRKGNCDVFISCEKVIVMCS